MIRGFYTAAAGMIAQQRRQEMLTNNIANVNTPGYKEDRASLRTFPKMLIDRMENQIGPKDVTRRSTRIGEMATGAYLQETTPNFAQGSLEETGASTDIALVTRQLPNNGQGALLFTVRNQNGEVRYTKNGNFTVNGQGFLTTGDGYYVLDRNNNPIRPMNEQFKVDASGNVYNGQGANLGQMNIAYVQNANQLVKEGGNLYRLNGGQAVPAAGVNGAGFSLEQGFIERSNVNIEQAMTDMMTAYRAFEANQKVLQAYDRSLDKTVNEVGRLR